MPKLNPPIFITPLKNSNDRLLKLNNVLMCPCSSAQDGLEYSSTREGHLAGA